MLPGDEVEFEVDAVELQEERIYYYWMVGEDTVSRRASTDVRFDELGEYSVKCVVSDGELSDSVMWRVTAEEWYIDNYAPDSLAWAVRRPYEVDFSLHVRAIEGVEPRYRWLMTDREHRQVDLGNDSGMTYNFDLSGDFRIEIRVSHDDIERSVNWQVAVKSVLWWWRPHEREFETYLNEPTGFSVIPLNADSDSLSYLWRVDGAARIDTTDGIVYTFDSLDEHRVTAIVHDGAEVETVVWTVNVVEENAVDDDRTSLLPTEVTLRYFLPRSADVSLTAYDSTGRLVQRLSEGLTTSGEHRATIQGAELPAGIYLLRLDTGSAVRSMKVVLLK